MKKFLIALLLGATLGLVMPGTAPAYLHVDVATDSSRTFWNNICCSPDYTWRSRVAYRRISDDRVDIRGDGWRNGVYGCRWTIVRGSDQSRYTVFHPDSDFQPGCGGV